MIYRICLAGLLTGLIGMALAGCSLLPGASNGPPDELVQRLTRGVNLSQWWTQPASHGVLSGLEAPTVDEFTDLRAAGFTHVRIPLDPERVFTDTQPSRLRDDAITRLVRDLEGIFERDLAVILVLQMESADKARLFVDPAAAGNFVARWQLLADALSDLPADRLALELLNEPEVDNPWAWGGLQARLVEAVRASAPRHTLIVTGAHYSDPVDLVAMGPYPDDNLIYTFHFYTPHNFTHQGATWGWDMWRRLRNLPYPSSPESVAAAAETVDPGARDHVLHYGRQQWDRAKLAQRIDLVSQWAGRHDLVVQCTEFGVISKAPRADRVRWLRDARTLMEDAGFGWTLWDYAGEFSVTDADESGRRLRDADLQALGLR